MSRRTALCLALVCLTVFVTQAADGIPISGRVHDASGAPLAEAEVLLHETPERAATGDAMPESIAIARTDAKGRFHLVAPRVGLFTVRVELPGYVAQHARIHPLLDAVVLPPLELAADEGLEVRVVSAAGEPAAGAFVHTRPPKGRRMIFASSRAEWQTPSASAHTDETGRARLPLAAGSALWVGARHDELGTFETQSVRGAALRAELSGGVPSEVRVHAPGGGPVPGASVFSALTELPLGTTDASGRLRFVADPEILEELVVRAPGGRRASGTLTLDESGETAEAQIELPELLALQGRLVDAETGRGIEGGLVWESGQKLGAATARGGAFEIPIAGKKSTSLECAALGYLPSESLRVVLGDGAHAPTLALRPGAFVEGIVRDESGAPLGGAAMTLSPKLSPGMMRIEIGGGGGLPDALSDDEGRFRLGPIQTGKPLVLNTKAAGFAEDQRDLAPLAPYATESGVEIVLEQGARIVGTVVDAEGHAIAGAQIESKKGLSGHGGMNLVLPGQGGGGSTATSDGDGYFELLGLRSGTYDLTVTRRGFAKTRATGLRVEEGQERVQADPITLVPGTFVDGWVYDTDGMPIEGAEVRVSQGGPTMVFVMAGGAAAGDRGPQAVTGTDGYFRIDDLAPGEKVTVKVTRTGFGKVDRPGVELPRDQALEIEMSPASAIRGTVLGPDEQPVPGAEVTLTRDVTQSFGGNTMMMRTQMSANADEAGEFVFEDQQPGKATVAAVATGLQEAVRGDLDVVKGEDLVDVVLTLPPGAVVVGQVMLADGRPAIGARVGPVSDSPDPILGGGVRVDGEGRYHLDGLVPGIVSIQALGEGGDRVVRELEVREGYNTLDLHFEGGNPVSGWVRGPGGEALSGAYVRLAPLAKPWGGPGTTTGRDGRFRFEGVRSGDYSVQASYEGLATPREATRVTVAEGAVDDVEIRLEEGAVLEGRVVGLSPKDYAKVRVMAASSSFQGGSSSGVDRDGAFRLEGLGPGRWEVRATVADSGRTAQTTVEIQPGASALAELRFGDGFTLSGRAHRDGQPLRDAVLNAIGRTVDDTGWARTDDEGRFAVEDLEPGVYRLDLQQWQTGLTHSQEVELSASREIEIEIPVASVAGRVVDALTREPIPGVRLGLSAARSDGGSSESFFGGLGATSDLDGRFRIANVTDGAWTLRGSKSGFAAITRELDVQGGRSVEGLELILDPTDGLILDIRLAGGGAPDQVRLAVLDGAGATLLSGSYATGENGRVRLSSVPAGSWTVVAGTHGTGAVQQVVSAPGAAVPLLLPERCSLRVRVPALAASTSLGQVALRDAQGRPFRALGWTGTVQSAWRMGGGELVVEGLPPGRFTVEVRTAEGGHWQGEAAASPGVLAELVLD